MSTTSSSGSKPSGMWQPPSLEEMQAMLSQYQFISLLGRGGMGAVYKAVQVSLDRAVAIKVLPGDLIDDVDAQFAERFKNEARTMAKMNHPSIVNVYDFGETQTGLLFIVMEFIDGTDVSKMIISQGKLPEDYALSITAHVCDALNYAHTHGVIHRDIKPANILINMDGAVKVADFGLAKQSDAGMSGLTKTNMAMGTPDFVAPEALIPGIPLDGRADLYAIGVMLYQMLTGEIPRGMWTMPGMKFGTDPRFDAIIGKAMQSDREVRYQSAVELRRDLDTILTTPRAMTQPQPAAAPVHQTAQKPPSHGPKPPQGQKPADKPPSAPPPPKRANFGMIIGLGATAVLLIGGYIFLKPPAPSKKAVTAATSAPVVPPKPTPQPPATPKPATKTPSPAPAKQGSTPAPVTVSSPLPTRPVIQTLDLLALTDPVLDRIPVPGMVAKNEWKREGGELVYQPDGKSGKLAAPVAFDLQDYEIEFKAVKHSGNDRIHVDVPLKNGRILPLILNGQGRRVLSEKAGMSWGESSDSLVHVTIRVIDGTGASDRIVIQRQNVKGNPVADWTGDLDSLAKSGEDHPTFPKQPVTSVFVVRDKYAVQTWTLRVFEGEAKVLRGTASTPPIADTGAEWKDAIDLMPLIDPQKDKVAGNWRMEAGKLVCEIWGVRASDLRAIVQEEYKAGGARIEIPYQPPMEYDFRIVFTRRGRSDVVQMLSKGGKSFKWGMGNFDNKWKGFDLINGKTDNPTRTDFKLEDGRTYVSEVQVRNDGLKAFVDGKLAAEWKTDYSDMSQHPFWKMRDDSLLGVGAWASEATFTSIQVREVTGKGRFTRAAPPPAMATAPAASAIPAGELAFGGHRYRFVPGSTSWPEAKAKAEAMGGHLAAVTTKEEDAWIMQQFSSKLERGGQRIWLGGWTDQKGGTWKWVTGEPFDFHHWGAREPDYGPPNGSKPAEPPFSTTIYHAGGSPPKIEWHDAPKHITQSIGFLVEWDEEKSPVTALAAASVTTPPMTPAASPPTAAPQAISSSNDPRLAQLESGFKARYETDAQKPFLAALAALNQSYIANGIARARAAAQAKGALAEVTALDAEKTRIQNNEALPPADLETLPESLKALRTTYRTAFAKIEAERVQKAAPLYDLYLGALDAYIADLTKGNKIDEAQQVKVLRDDIATQKPKADAGAATVQPGTPASTGMNKSGTKPAPAESEDATSGRRSRWYEAARWVVSVGGWLDVNKNGQYSKVRNEADIPAGKFDILVVNIEGNGNPKVAGMTDDDFTRLSGLKELRSVRLRDIKVGDNALAFLPTTPALTFLELANLKLTDAVLTHIAPLRELTDLTIESVRPVTGAGLEKLASLPVLKKVEFSSTGFNDGAAKALAAAKNLETLDFTSTSVTDEGIAGFGALTKLTDIVLTDCKQVHGTTLAQWGNMATLKRLDLRVCPLNPDVFPIIGRFIHLTNLEVGFVTALNDETLPALAPLTKLTRIGVTQTRVTGTGFAALRACAVAILGLNAFNGTTPISAEGLAAIAAAFPKLENLGLGQGARLQGADFRPLAGMKELKTLDANMPTLDDAALAEIGQLTSLERLDVHNSAVTAKGITALKSLKFLRSPLLVHGCKGLDDSAIPALKEMKWLKQIDTLGNGMSDAGIADLRKALPHCNVRR